MKAGVHAESINPFIEAVTETLAESCNLEVQRNSVSLKGPGGEDYGVSGIIGLVGAVSGAVVLHLPEQVAIKLVGAHTEQVYAGITAEVLDGVGELTAAIAAAARQRLQATEAAFDVGLPKVVVGRSYITTQSKAVTCIAIGFTSPVGSFALEVSMQKAD